MVVTIVEFSLFPSRSRDNSIMLTIKNKKMDTAKLTETDSTLTDQDFTKYVSMLTNLGFENVLQIPFSCKKEGTYLLNETFHVFFSKNDGMLICCETYRSGTLLHGGMLYYSHPSSDQRITETWAIGSNRFHHTTKNICIGSNDARHKIIRLVTKIRSAYSLMPQWINQGGPGIWFLHSGDVEYSGYDSKAINAERWEMLPGHVRKAIPKF